MSLKIRAILAMVIGVVMGLGLSFGGRYVADQEALAHNDRSWDKAQLLAEVIEHIKRDYVEPIDDAELLDSAIRGMVHDLDPHSEFLDANEYRDIRSTATGSYTGVGVNVIHSNGALRVISPIAGSPAARAGILSGDVLIAIDGEPIPAAARKRETLQRLRGQIGTRVSLTIVRGGVTIEHSMRRQRIQIASVHREFLRPSFAYVRVSEFNDNTAAEVSTAIDELQHEQGGMLDGVLLDLRNNPGGVLDAAVDVADLFLDKGVIVTARGRAPESRFTRSAHHGDVLDGSTLVVLVNSGSASASEIVAGALQDHNRAIIVGTATFGKGLVQTVLPLSKGRAIKLTTSRYFTPSGDSIHEVGVTPDILIDDTAGFPDLYLASGIDAQNDAQLVEAMQQLQPQAVMHSSAE